MKPIQPHPSQSKQLHRSSTNRVVFGVCGGLGEYFNIDPIVFRIIFIALTLGAGSGILLYMILAIVMPKDTESTDSTINVKQRAEELVAELKENQTSNTRKQWVGIVVIVVGLALLVNQFFPRDYFNGNMLWAVIIIVTGIFLVSQQKPGHHNTEMPPTTKNATSVSTIPEINQQQSSQVNNSSVYSANVGRVLFGLILVILGIALLAQNFGIISGINFGFIGKFWPLAIIFAGASLFSHNSWVSIVVSVLFAVTLTGIIIASLFTSRSTSGTTQYPFNISTDPEAVRSEVTIKTGAATVQLQGGATGMISGNLESNVNKLHTSSITTTTGVQQVNLSTEGDLIIFAGQVTNTLITQITNQLPLSLSVDAGASKLNLDTSTLQLENLSINAGAASVTVTFGSVMPNSTAIIKAGASSIVLRLPKDLGVALHSEGGLSSKNYPNFRQTSENNFESDNYSVASKKLDLTIDAGVSSSTIYWY